MRKILLGFILLTFGVILSTGIFAQPTPQPPAPPENKGTNGNQPPPGNTPIGGPIEPGTGILLLLAVGYGLRKVKDVRNQASEEVIK
jgi:hypothetical protein